MFIACILRVVLITVCTHYFVQCFSLADFFSLLFADTILLRRRGGLHCLFCVYAFNILIFFLKSFPKLHSIIILITLMNTQLIHSSLQFFYLYKKCSLNIKSLLFNYCTKFSYFLSFDNSKMRKGTINLTDCVTIK